MNRIGDNLICTGANKEIIQSFTDKNVDFILIGSLAVAWYCAERNADDMDLLVNCSKQNSEKVCAALQELNINGLELDSFTAPGKIAPIKHYYYADILTQSRNGLTYEEVSNKTQKAKLFGICVNLPDRECLIVLLQQAIKFQEGNVQKYERDIELLRKHNV